MERGIDMHVIGHMHVIGPHPWSTCVCNAYACDAYAYAYAPMEQGWSLRGFVGSDNELKRRLNFGLGPSHIGLAAKVCRGAPTRQGLEPARCIHACM